MKKKGGITFLMIVIVFVTCSSCVFAEQVSPPGMGFGVCHWPGTYGMARSDSTVNWYYSGGGAEDWIKIEPQRGQYDFAPMDAQFEKQFKSKPNSYFWLDIMTAMPSTVPDWAKQDTSLGYIELSSTGKASTFPIWNKEYQKVFEALLTKTSEHIYSPSFKYRNNLKAVIMMSGGSFGEMITWGGCPNGNLCKKYEAAGYTDKGYIDAMANWLVPLYVRLFPDKPLILQLGGGIYDQGIAGLMVKTLYDKFGSKIYLKWNGWNHQISIPDKETKTDKYYQNLMAQYADRTRVGFEPGGIVEFPADMTQTTNQIVYNSLVKTLQAVPVSYFCLQDKYYQLLTDTQLKELSLRMRGLHSIYPTFPPLPTISPTVSPTPTFTSSNPDINGDGKVTVMDYFYLVFARAGGLIPLMMSADVNKDRKVDGTDIQVLSKILIK